MKVRRGNNAIGFMFGFLLRAGAGVFMTEGV